MTDTKIDPQVEQLTHQVSQLNQMLTAIKAESYDTISFFRAALTRAEAQIQMLSQQLQEARTEAADAE